MKDDAVDFIFWNVNRKPVQPTISRLLRVRQPTLLILAESTIADADLLGGVNRPDGP